MARKSFVLLVMGTVTLLLSSASSADVPSVINYQGKLTTPAGGCLNDTVQMTFSIYPDTLGSPADWTETQTEVIVKDGIFNVLLGSVNPIPGTVFDGSTKYLGVQVESDPEMRPLKPMVSVGYAFTDGDWTADGDNIYRLQGNVGIGTTSPEAELDLTGAQAWTFDELFKISTSGPQASLEMYTLDSVYGAGLKADYEGNAVLYCGSGVIGFWTGMNGVNTEGTWRMTIRQDGNVGIGTTNPSTRLAVAGLSPTSAYNNLRYNPSDGSIYYATSSRKYKEDVQPLEENFSKILKAKPKSFIDRTSGETEIGFIAEEFDALGLNNLVIYRDGQPDAIKYELVSLYLLEMMKELKMENKELKQRIEALETK